MMLSGITEQLLNLLTTGQTCIIGIDGLGGAGKSTISIPLLDALQKNGCACTLLHIDDFIHPKAIRYNDSVPEWECYYHLQWRYDYLVDEVLRPAKNGSFCGDVEFYDKDNDCYFCRNLNIPAGSIVIVEGVFLQREELRGIFDYMLYLDVPEEIRLERVLARDGYIGDAAQIREKYANRYFPAEHHYVRACSPKESANMVISVQEMSPQAE